ncbi:Intermembrane phospholipid transport system binding protein MlaD [Myxococcaceae bacterium]|jgi:phospholipid/cholesterol/gamma-HCH transport system substrate-binding protein|nr:Intermembrane phospholipid transport system binding protein MlaD [Myxococcaceae bacterium]
MQPSPSRDLAVGLFVLAGLCAVAWLSVQVGGLALGPSDRSVFHASFDQVGGLKPRAPVVVAGVRVGSVVAISLGEDLRAHVTLDVDGTLKLPDDTSAAIRTSGLLGDQFIALEPGGSETALAPGSTIAFTQNALSIESLIAKFATGLGSGGEK